MSNVYLGIDIAKDKFDAAILFDEEIKTNTFTNNALGFKKLSKWLGSGNNDKSSLHTCMEATGIYSKPLATFCVEQDMKFSVVNPIQIKGFAQSSMVRNKTDKTDAILIAKFCKAMQPSLWHPSEKSVTKLQALVRRLNDLQDIYYQEQNRLEAAPDLVIKQSIKKILKYLKLELDAIEQKITQHIHSDKLLDKKHGLLLTIPGIGSRTISRLLAFCSDIDKFSNAKQLAAYAGLNPSHNQSGKSVNGKSRLSKIGNAEIRNAIYMPTLVAMKHNPIIKNFCEQLKAKGKPKMVIVCAAMRKLIHLIYGVLKSEMPFTINKTNTTWRNML